MKQMNIFNVKETAEYLNCSVSSIRKMVRNKEIAFFRIGSKINFTQESIESWIKKQQELNSRKNENVFISIR